MTRLTMNSQGGLPPQSAAFGPPPRKTPVLLYAGLGAVFLVMFTALVVTTTLLVVQSRDNAQLPQLASAEAAAAPAPAPTPAVEAAEPVAAEATPEVTRTSVNLLDNDLVVPAPAPVPAPEPVAFAPPVLNERIKAPSCIDYLDTLVKITHVRFPLGSNEPHPADMPRVRNIATALAMCPEVKVIVEGHSDRQGNDDLNMELSWYRAQTVMQKLADEGFETASMEPLGFGARRPINLSGTVSGEGENRRVQFQLVPSDTVIDQLAQN